MPKFLQNSSLLHVKVAFSITIYLILFSLASGSLTTPVYADSYLASDASECDSEHSFESQAPAPALIGEGICRHINTSTSAPAGPLSNVTDPLNNKFTNLGQVASNLLPLILLLGGMVAFIFILWGGIKYMTAQGDPKAIAAARGTVVSAIIGLVILASIFAILRLISFVFKINILSSFIAPVFALEHGVDIGCAFKIGENQDQCITDVFPTFGSLFTAVVGFILAAAGLIFFFMLVWGGIRYMTARGDDKTISSARDTLTNAVIGLLIIVSSFAIIKLISIVTGANISIF